MEFLSLRSHGPDRCGCSSNVNSNRSLKRRSTRPGSCRCGSAGTATTSLSCWSPISAGSTRQGRRLSTDHRSGERQQTWSLVSGAVLVWRRGRALTAAGCPLRVQPEVPLLQLRGRQVERVRSCRRRGRGAKPLGELQPALPLRRGIGLRQDPLLHAIGHEIQRRHPQLKVLYLTAESFVNELINSIRFERMPAFRETLSNDRRVDHRRRAIHRQQGAHAGGSSSIPSTPSIRASDRSSCRPTRRRGTSRLST